MSEKVTQSLGTLLQSMLDHARVAPADNANDEVLLAVYNSTRAFLEQTSSSKIVAQDGKTVSTVLSVMALRMKASREEYGNMLREKKQIPQIVEHLRVASLQTKALFVIRLLCCDTKNHDAIHNAGGIHHFIKLLNESPHCADNAAAALWNLNSTFKDVMCKTGAVPALCQSVADAHFNFFVAADSKAAQYVSEDVRNKVLTNGIGALLVLAHNNERAKLQMTFTSSKGMGTPVLPVLVSILKSERSDAARAAVDMLTSMSLGKKKNKDAVREEGGIRPLVAQLGLNTKDDAGRKNVNSGLVALACIANSNDANQHAICEGGAIPHLLKILGAVTAAADNELEENVGYLISCLAFERDAIKNELRDAIPHLVVISHRRGVKTRVQGVQGALLLLVDGENISLNQEVLLESRIRCGKLTGGVEWKVCRIATALLDRAVGMRDAAKINATIERVRALNVDDTSVKSGFDASVKRALQCLTDIDASTMRKRKLEELGLGEDDLPTPPEFRCRITLERMEEPVVASDGFTYDRRSIHRVISIGNGLSPMTRAPLTDTLTVNFNLLQIMSSYDDKMLEFATKAVEQSRRGITGHKRKRDGSTVGLPRRSPRFSL